MNRNATKKATGGNKARNLKVYEVKERDQKRQQRETNLFERRGKQKGRMGGHDANADKLRKRKGDGRSHSAAEESGREGGKKTKNMRES